MKHLGSPMLTDLFHVFSIYVMIMAFYNSGFGSVYMLVFGLFLIFISGSLFSPLTGIRLAKRVEMNVQPRFQSTMHPALKYMSFARPIFIFLCTTTFMGNMMSEEALAYRVGLWHFSSPAMFALHMRNSGLFEIDSTTLFNVVWSDVQGFCWLGLVAISYYVELQSNLSRQYKNMCTVRAAVSKEVKDAVESAMATEDKKHT